jgi:hypothetical protein
MLLAFTAILLQQYQFARFLISVLTDRSKVCKLSADFRAEVSSANIKVSDLVSTVR